MGTQDKERRVYSSKLSCQSHKVIATLLEVEPYKALQVFLQLPSVWASVRGSVRRAEVDAV
jgi:hypothetical protein